MSGRQMIPVSTPFQATRTMDYVGECISTGWLSSSGRFLEQFEREWAAYCGVRHGVAVTSGTAALHIAVAALELPAGSEIIMPSFTIVSCVTAVLAADCVPVLVDVDPETWCMAIDQIEARITPRTRALMPVHMYGHPVDMDALMSLARRHRLAVIEDAAEAHGVRCHGRRAGGIGEMGCFSFYANKVITTGEGGMVVTNDDVLAVRLRMARNLGFISERRFLHRKLGQNYRMTNLQAAVGVAQLEEIDRALDHKRWLAAAYRDRLGGHNALTLQAWRPWVDGAPWMFGVVLTEDAAGDAADVARRLAERGVETRPFFLGMHEQPALLDRRLFAGERYPVSERLARRGFYLPSGFGLTAADVERVCEATQAVLS